MNYLSFMLGVLIVVCVVAINVSAFKVKRKKGDGPFFRQLHKSTLAWFALMVSALFTIVLINV